MLVVILMILIFITIVYYGIVTPTVSNDYQTPFAKSQYSESEIENLFNSLKDYSIPTFETEFKNLEPYFNNAITSLAYDVDETDRLLRLTILYDIEPILSNNIQSLDDFKYVGGDELFSDLTNWYDNVVALSSAGDRIMDMTKALINETSKLSFLNINYMKAILHCVETITNAIDVWPYKANTFPWGANWYQFSVSIPYSFVCIYYLLKNIYYFDKESILKIQNCTILWIDKLTESPCVSLGWRRTGPNTILMGAPWTVVKYWQGKLDEIGKIDDVLYMIDQANINFVTDGEGMRPDGGYYFHTNVRAYGYISSSLKSAIMLNCIYKNVYQIGYQFLSNIMCHPSIEANLAGLWSREKTVKRFMSPGKLGSFTQYSSGILTYKTANIFVQIMACIENVAYYESDKSEKAWAQAWFQLREMWIRGMPIRQYDENTLAYMPGILTLGPDYKTMICPTKTSTTTSMIPKSAASFIISANSFSSLCSLYKIQQDVSYYDYLNGYTVLEFSILQNDYRFSMILIQTDGNEGVDFSTRYIIESGTLLNEEVNSDFRMFRFTNGKNIIVKNDTYKREDEVVFKDNHGNDLKEIPISTSLKPLEKSVIAQNNIYYGFGLVWYDASEGSIELPIDVSTLEIVGTNRGIRLSLGSYLFLLDSYDDHIRNLTADNMYEYCILDKDKLDSGEVGLTVAIKSQKDVVAIKGVYIPMLFENLPLGIWFYPKLDPKYTGITSLIKISGLGNDLAEKIPGVAGSKADPVSYFYLQSANDFDFSFKFCIERYRKEVDWNDINFTLTKGLNRNNAYLPLLEVREMPNAIACGDGFDPRFYKKADLPVIGSRLTSLNISNKSSTDDIIANLNTWDPWSF